MALSPRPKPAFREYAGASSVYQDMEHQVSLLADARAELGAILTGLAGHFEDEARDDQYRLEQLEEQLTALFEHIGGDK